MAVSVPVLKNLVDEFSGSVATGAGLNLLRRVTRMIEAGEGIPAAELLTRAASKGRFGSNLDDIEKAALRRLFNAKDLGVTPMASDLFSAMAKTETAMPLMLTAQNFPKRMADLGFIPLTGQNINNPGLTLRSFVGPTRERFIDEGARNLEAAIALNPQAAAEYAKFYPKVAQQLEATGIPTDRVGGAWATLSAQAEPEWNAELLRRILRDPTGATTSQSDQMKALQFLAGQVDDPAAVLGQGKRFNFLQNSINPDDPRFLTADTRYAQNMQGVKNAYRNSAFAGMFQPFERRYGEIYVEPGLEAARRLGMSPNAAQAAAWGNWRSEMFGIPMDVRTDLMSDISNFDYDPELYARALRQVAESDPETWKAALKARKDLGGAE